MNQAEIIAMATEAGARSEHWATRLFPAAQFLFTPDELSRFSALVAANEREACQKIADDCADADMHASMAANAIRARGQKEGV